MAMRGLTRYPKGLGRQRDNIAGMLLDMLQDKLPYRRTRWTPTHAAIPPFVNIICVYCKYLDVICQLHRPLAVGLDLPPWLAGTPRHLPWNLPQYCAQLPMGGTHALTD